MIKKCKEKCFQNNAKDRMAHFNIFITIRCYAEIKSSDNKLLLSSLITKAYGVHAIFLMFSGNHMNS